MESATANALTGARGRLVALDGTSGAMLLVAARDALAAIPSAARGGLSRWDASGLFEELAMADERAGMPSARTLLLLYAADLAFRVRWEIAPTIAAGRTVIAAPYVDTAVAFGRAVGLPAAWLSNLFRFAPRPSERRVVEAVPLRARPARPDPKGFVEVVCEHWIEPAVRRRQIVEQVMARLVTANRRPRRCRTRPCPS